MEEQLRQAMRDYREYCIKKAYSFVKDWASAEEIVQDVFLPMPNMFALLEDGREIFLTEGPFSIENYKEQMIEKLIQSIDNK